MTNILVKDRRQGILRLTLNDPKTRNSLSEAMMASLAIALDEAKQDPETRVIVIAAEGAAFCSGHNLKEITERRRDDDRGKAYFAKLMAHCSALMQEIVHHPRPVIAEVAAPARSEEHTSELQSLRHLVCRLLL